MAALFLQHIAHLRMQCAGELARSNGATVVQAMSWQNCLGARRYGAQTRQAEGFWRGRIVAYAGVGSIARDTPVVIANIAKHDIDYYEFNITLGRFYYDFTHDCRWIRDVSQSLRSMTLNTMIFC